LRFLHSSDDSFDLPTLAESGWVLAHTLQLPTERNGLDLKLEDSRYLPLTTTVLWGLSSAYQVTWLQLFVLVLIWISEPAGLMAAPHCSSSFEQSQFVLAAVIDDVAVAITRSRLFISFMSDSLCDYSYIACFEVKSMSDKRACHINHL
jgi:hypothetical protein